MLQLRFLDHVAIRVKDLDASCQWYQDVLGLSAHQMPEWGPFPIFLLVGQTGVALFPKSHQPPETSPLPMVDHFAFNVDGENFNKAQHRFKELGIPFQIQDHHYFHSVYIQDPDGHTVELTTLVVDKNPFVKSATREKLITNINPVIPVSNMNQSVSYYQEKLGFALTYDSTRYETGPMNYAVLCRDRICIHLQLFDDHQQLTMPSLRFVVSDLETLYGDLKERKAIDDHTMIRKTPWATLEFGLYDPDNVGLTFYQEV